MTDPTEDNVTPIRPGMELVEWEPADVPEVIATRNDDVMVYASIIDTPVIAGKSEIVQWLDDCRGAAGYRWHKTKVHAMRLHLYAGRASVHSPRGLWVTLRWWFAWVRDVEMLDIIYRVATDNSLAGNTQQSAHAKAREDRKIRVRIRWGVTITGLIMAVLLYRYAWNHHLWLALLVALAVVVGLGLIGAQRHEIVQFVDDATDAVVSAERVVRAFFKAKIAKDVEEPARVIGIPHKVGLGVLVRVEVPEGVTFDDVLKAKDRLASSLHCPKQCLELDDLPDEAESLLEIFIAAKPASKVKVPDWPLLNVDRFDVFQPVPMGWTPRGDLVALSLMWVHTLLGAAPRRGKALDVETPMLTSGGWKTMGSLEIGDEVFHPDGHPTKVVGAFEVMEDRRCYRVTTTDGRTIVADADHLWTVGDRRNRGHRGPAPWETITTEEMLNRGLTADQGRAFAFRLPQQEAVISKPIDLPIDPYLFGSWLGDGSSSSARLYVGDQDVAQMTRQIEEVGARVVSSTRRETCWWISFNIDTPMRDGFQSRIMRLGVQNNKHIPEAYLTAGTEQRLALLQGLMDTDGSAPVDRRSRTVKVEFSSKWRPLAEGVLYLCRSLGLRATLNEGAAYLNGVEAGRRYRVTWTPQDGDPNPFRLPRKVAVVEGADGRPQRRSISSIKTIELVESRPVRCIKVDREDGLFLAGRDLMPTHNTTILRMMCLAFLLDPRARLIVVDFGGGADYKPLQPYCLKFICGPSAAQIEEFLALLGWLNDEYQRRQVALAALPIHLCPEARITPALAERPEFAPILVAVDEFQVATLVKKMGDQEKMGEHIVRTWAELQKVCAKVGISFVEATQSADDSVPTELRNIALSRVALTMASYQASMAVLGNTAHKLGYDASTLGGLPGLGYSWGTDDGDVDGYRGKVRFANCTPAHASALLERIARIRRPVGTVEAAVAVDDVPAGEPEAVPSIVRDALKYWPRPHMNCHQDVLAGLMRMDQVDLGRSMRAAGFDADVIKMRRPGEDRTSGKRGYRLVDLEAVTR